MRNLKFFGLAALATMALMALAASSASATALYSGSTKLSSGSTIDFSIPSGKSTVMVDTGNEELDTCSTSTAKGKLSSETTASIEQLTLGSCTFPITILFAGRIVIHWTGGTNGSVTVTETIEWLIHTIFFGDCIYGVTSGSSLGTLAGNPATFTVNAVAEKFSGSNLACPSTAKWTGTYNSTEPANLHVEEH